MTDQLDDSMIRTRMLSPQHKQTKEKENEKNAAVHVHDHLGHHCNIEMKINITHNCISLAQDRGG